ncbi:aromatic ring-hydroxylating oxygenase subunit alpha [Pseudonocardia oceani]|nr:Rieske 2Fe-2S domain-containing protein [Pseudonocardia oceani]
MSAGTDAATGVPYAELVQADRVHSRLYTDPQVFADEMDRIFHSGWVYVAHTSEVGQPGDYVLKTIGTQPVIVSRDADGDVHVLFNRCSHLANLLCHDPRGNSSSFRCPYHGWTFRNDGDLVGVPFRPGYGPDFARADHGLARPAHTQEYRGFLFASVAADVPALAEFLGPARETIDRLCELSPEGEIELTAGWLHHRTETNWKIAFENEIDAYHGNFVHRSLTMMGNWSLVADADVTSEKALSQTRYLGNGHTDMDWRPQFRKVGRKYLWLGATAEEKLADYAGALARRHGREHADELLVDGPPHTMIFPNLFIAELFILVIEPLAAGGTIQHQAPIRWKGADQLNRRAFQLTGGSIGPAGMVIADDSAMYERNFRGMAAQRPEWLLRSRGLHREQTLPDGVEVSHATDDTSHRAFWRNYLRLMTGGGSGR